jgi:hypothetical protein
VIPVIKVAWNGLTGRLLQTIVIALVVLASTAASALALGMIVETNAPFDHAFTKDHGAQVALAVNTATTSAAQLAATAKVSGVTAAAGPFPETEITAHITFPGAAGALEQQLVLTGRASPGGPVDDLVIDSGRWARTPGEIVWARGATGLPVQLGQKITVTRPRSRIPRKPGWCPLRSARCTVPASRSCCTGSPGPGRARRSPRTSPPSGPRCRPERCSAPPSRISA